MGIRESQETSTPPNGQRNVLENMRGNVHKRGRITNMKRKNYYIKRYINT